MKLFGGYSNINFPRTEQYVIQILQMNISKVKPLLKSRYTWAAAFLAFCIVAFILELKHTAPKCNWEYKGIDIRGSAGCDTDFSKRICTAAFITTREMEMRWNDKPYYAEELRVCPWRAWTSTFNYISIGFSAIYMLIFMRVIRKVNYKQNLIVGVLAIVFTLISISLMANDIKAGSDKIAEIDDIYKANNFKYTQGGFIANIIFSIFAFLVMLALVVRSFRKQYQYKDRQEQEHAAKNKPAIPQEIPETKSIAITFN